MEIRFKVWLWGSIIHKADSEMNLQQLVPVFYLHQHKVRAEARKPNFILIILISEMVETLHLTFDLIYEMKF